METIDGLAYLLVTEGRGPEYVMRYTAAEVAELSRADEIKVLAKGGELIRGGCRYVDMIAAARAVR